MSKTSKRRATGRQQVSNASNYAKARAIAILRKEGATDREIRECYREVALEYDHAGEEDAIAYAQSSLAGWRFAMENRKHTKTKEKS